MRSIQLPVVLFGVALSVLFLCSCSSNRSYMSDRYSGKELANLPSIPADYSSRLPQHIAIGEKAVIVDPNVHAWGAYNSSGDLVKAGNAVAGAGWCSDIGRSCRTKVGSFRVYSLGSAGCKSSIFPVPRGGAPMPYCMFFHGGQALHGSPPSHLGEGNFSHGCVRLQVDDAEWLRFNFVNVGTKVVVRPYT